ncbi:MAG: hypothetical protein KGL39_15875 [Patescibacteria group bacterium]|nr:hypothetical protein [Patescibacteria group bacterium]
MPASGPAYFGLTAALTNGTAQSLYALLGGSESMASRATSTVPLTAREVTIQNPNAAGVLAIGGAKVTAINRALDLAVNGASHTYRASEGSQIYLDMIYVLASAGGLSINIEVLQ